MCSNKFSIVEEKKVDDESRMPRIMSSPLLSFKGKHLNLPFQSTRFSCVAKMYLLKSMVLLVGSDIMHLALPS
jgi:hypothetical protein